MHFFWNGFVQCTCTYTIYIWIVQSEKLREEEVYCNVLHPMIQRVSTTYAERRCKQIHRDLGINRLSEESVFIHHAKICQVSYPFLVLHALPIPWVPIFQFAVLLFLYKQTKMLVLIQCLFFYTYIHLHLKINTMNCVFSSYILNFPHC